MKKTYLGDSVYVQYSENEAIDGLVLTTENGDGFPTNQIFLEGPMFNNLIEYINTIRESFGVAPIIIPRSNDNQTPIK